MKDDLITQVEYSVRAEQKWSDGIPQIVSGAYMILVMLMMLGDNSSMFVIFIPIIPILIEGLRRRFTYPRVGRAVLRENVSHRMVMLWIVAAFLIAGVVAMLFTKYQNPALDYTSNLWYWFVPIVLVVLMFTMFYRSWRVRNKRAIWYELFIAIMVAYIVFFRPEKHVVEYIMLIFGALNLVYGVITLIRFARKYPVVTDAQ